MKSAGHVLIPLWLLSSACGGGRMRRLLERHESMMRM